MRLILTVLITGFLISCSDKPAKGILDKPQMQSMIWDMMLADEFATGYLYNDTALILKDERLKLYKDVFRIHNVSQKNFTDSYRYYSARPDLMKELFDSLAAQGEREKKMLYLPKDSIPGKGAAMDSARKAFKADSLAGVLKTDSLKAAFKADSLKATLKADSLKAKLKADSLKAKLKADSLRRSRKLNKNRKDTAQ